MLRKTDMVYEELKSNVAVYAIRNIKNGKMYVGSSSNVKSRWNNHYNTLKKSKHHSVKLQRAWGKYGEDSFVFEVLEYVEKDELIEAEQQYMDFYEAYTECGYNVSAVAGAPQLGRKHTEESRARMRAAQKNRPPISEETRKKRSESCRAAKSTPEARARQSEISKNLVISPETRKKIADAKRGKPLPKHTVEAKAKMSKALKESWARRKKLKEEAQNGL